MEISEYIAIFKDLATKHKQIRNGATEGGSIRNCFYRLSDENEVIQATGKDISYPYLGSYDYAGVFSDNGIIDNIMFGRFEIRDHVKSILNFDDVEAAKQRCFKIGKEIVMFLYQAELNDQNQAAIPFFMINTVRYSFTGPINNSEIGCMFTFQFKDVAFDFEDNLNQWFNL